MIPLGKKIGYLLLNFIWMRVFLLLTERQRKNPIRLREPGKAILQIGLYRPVDTKKATFEELWKQSEYPEEEESWGPVTEGPSVEACFKMVFLEDFIRNPGIITEWIQNAMRKAC